MTAKSKAYFVGLLVLAFVGAVYLSWTIWAPQYAETRYKKYIELYRQGDLETAVGEINTAIFFDPKNADYYCKKVSVCTSAHFFQLILFSNNLFAPPVFNALNCTPHIRPVTHT